MNNSIRKGVVVAVILLFIGLAFAPSINANVSKASLDSELVEFTTEVCGLNSGKHTVQLTKEEAEEVEQLFDDIKVRLDEVETREEAVEIFDEAVVELDKYGLLGGLSVKQAQRLVTQRFQNQNVMKLLKRIYGNYQTSTYNIFCLIAGHIVKECWFIRPIHRFLNVFGVISFILSSLLMPIFPPSILSDITFGWGGIWFEGPFEAFPASGWIYTIGLIGKHSYNGSFYGNIKEVQGFGRGAMMVYMEYYVGATGFTGLKIINEDAGVDFIGSAFRVNIGTKHP